MFGNIFGTGLSIRCKGYKNQHFPQAVKVVEKGGLRHLVDAQGNWVQTVFKQEAQVVTLDGLFANFCNI